MSDNEFLAAGAVACWAAALGFGIAAKRTGEDFGWFACVLFAALGGLMMIGPVTALVTGT